MTASTCRWVPLSVETSKKSQASRAFAWEWRKSVQVVDVRSDAGSISGVLEDLSHRGRGDLDAEHEEEFAVDAAVAPGGVLLRHAQYQELDRAKGLWSAGALGSGSGGVAAIDVVAGPTHHCVRTYQQPESTKRRGRDAVQ
jgi:hypothetical protein